MLQDSRSKLWLMIVAFTALSISNCLLSSCSSSAHPGVGDLPKPTDWIAWEDISIGTFNIKAGAFLMTPLNATTDAVQENVLAARYRVEAPADTSGGAYLVVFEILSGQNAGTYRTAIRLPLYTEVKDAIRLHSVQLVQTTVATFIVVDYAARYHTNGPDATVWECALFAFRSADQTSGQPFTPVYTTQVKNLESLATPLISPDFQPLWSVSEGKVFLSMAGTNTTFTNLYWYVYDEKARHFIAVQKPSAFDLPAGLSDIAYH